MASDKMDRGLDEIIADTRGSAPRGRGAGRGPRRGGPRRDRQDFPRDGVRKSYRDEPKDLDSDWVHDRYDDNSNSRRGPAPRRQRDAPEEAEARGSKVRVQNIHYDLTEEDLDELFTRIGPISKLFLRYDRAGRSEGTAFVIYESERDAREAIRQFDGANANGQPIRLSLAGGGGGPSRNPFDSAVMPGRPLSERVTAPGGRARSHSPERHHVRDDASRKGIDRYIPGEGRRSDSPPRRRRGDGAGRGRRPGARREEREQGAGRGERGERGAGRGKKTQEELDAEMADYFGGNGAPAAEPANGNVPAQSATTTGATATTAAQIDDIDMIE